MVLHALALETHGLQYAASASSYVALNHRTPTALASLRRICYGGHHRVGSCNKLYWLIVRSRVSIGGLSAVPRKCVSWARWEGSRYTWYRCECPIGTVSDPCQTIVWNVPVARDCGTLQRPLVSQGFLSWVVITLSSDDLAIRCTSRLQQPSQVGTTS